MDHTAPDLPVLPAGRYTLRRWELSDLLVVREAAGDPLIPLITTVPTAWTDAEGVAYVERQWGRPATGAYPFAVTRTADDVAIGYAGLRVIGGDGGRPEGADRASVGYWVAASGRGAGAAGAALRAITDWGLRELRIARLELYVEPWNTGSLRTAEGAGYVREGLLQDWERVGGELKDMFMYAALRTPR